MENNEFKKARIENRTCYYFGDVYKKILILVIFQQAKNRMKIFKFITFHVKLSLFQNFYVLDSIKQMELLDDGTRSLTLFGSEKI